MGILVLALVVHGKCALMRHSESKLMLARHSECASTLFPEADHEGNCQQDGHIIH
jgi:hypothetical protein